MPLKLTVSGEAPEVGLADRCGDRRGVLRVDRVAVSDDPAAEVVNCEEVTAGPDLEPDGAHLAGEKLDGRRIGHSAATGVHHPDALPGEVGEEQRPVVGVG